ncbi:hypothetical protein C1646_770360 [Rhizophagus diaphanus]|nr:hypothetical protein C1646_770360 [Rhizophagus diaphanus] [Rhizophagus sp. MUCL 43196]
MGQCIGKVLINIKKPKNSSNIEGFEESGTSIEEFEGSGTKESKGISNVKFLFIKDSNTIYNYTFIICNM